MRKFQNYDLTDTFECIIHQVNPLIKKIKVLTIIAENIKEIAL